nr:putative integron gene cassette protein [uncultured bacterium]
MCAANMAIGASLTSGVPVSLSPATLALPHSHNSSASLLCALNSCPATLSGFVKYGAFAGYGWSAATMSSSALPMASSARCAQPAWLRLRKGLHVLQLRGHPRSA